MAVSRLARSTVLPREIAEIVQCVFETRHVDAGLPASTVAFAEHDNELEIELEEAFFETLSLGGGFTIRGGRFYSAVGYLNQIHEHAWDFKDAPLVYRALFGQYDRAGR